MFVAALVLILATAIFFFYVQVTCERILRRPFGDDYFRGVVGDYDLAFPAVRKELQEFDAAPHHPRLRTMLKCDFLTLRPMVEKAANANQRSLCEVHILSFYFRLTSASLALRHIFGMRENVAFLKLVAILEYFANQVGQPARIRA